MSNDVIFVKKDANKITRYYIFDAIGNMLSGQQTYNGYTYFMYDNPYDENFGAMAFGWHYVTEIKEMRYFDDKGHMLKNAVTPEGIILNAFGQGVGLTR